MSAPVDPFLERMRARTLGRRDIFASLVRGEGKENKNSINEPQHASDPLTGICKTKQITEKHSLETTSSSDSQLSFSSTSTSGSSSPVKKRGFQQLSQRTAEIQQWEDDYKYHSSMVKKEVDSVPKLSQKSLAVHVPPASASPKTYIFGESPLVSPTKPAVHASKLICSSVPASNSYLPSSPTKKLDWDQQMFKSLEAQGFTPTRSKSKLVYDYEKEKSPLRSVSPNKTGSPSKPVIPAHKYISPTKQAPVSEPINVTQKVVKLTSHWEQQIREASPGRGLGRSPGPGRRLLRQASVPALPTLVAQQTKVPSKKPLNRTVDIRSRSPHKPVITGHIIKGEVPMPSTVPVADSSTSVKDRVAAFTSAIGLKPQKDPAELSLRDRKNIFEKAKGPAIMPMAPFAQPVSAKALSEQKKTSQGVMTKGPSQGTWEGSKIKSRLAQFENLEEGSKIDSIKAERQKDLDMLNNRFKRPVPKKVEAVPQPMEESGTEYPESDTSVEGSVSACEQGPPKPPRVFLLESPIGEPVRDVSSLGHSPLRNLNSTAFSDVGSTSMSSPPKNCQPKVKPGCLFPSLSDIDQSDNCDSQFEDMKDSSFAESVLTCASGESLGTHIQKMAQNKQIDLASISESRHEIDDDSDVTTDAAMQDALDEAMDEESTPNTSKRSRDQDELGLDHHNYKTPKISADACSADAMNTPLTHSISMYRKQRAQDVEVTPVRQIVRGPEFFSPVGSPASPSVNVENNIRVLHQQEVHQLGVISQASGAINVVTQHPEQHGTPQHVEAEELLLIATQKRLAAMNEIQRLRAEGALGHPQEVDLCRGSLSLSNITLPLKQEFTSKITTEPKHHFLVLIKQREQVISSQIESTPGCVSENAIVFPNLISLHDLSSDFNICIEVYCFRVEKAPVNIKKDHSRMRLTPLKRLQKESRNSSPLVPSSGPSSMRSSSFTMVGFTNLNIATMIKNSWSLEKVPFTSPLDGHLLMRVRCTMEGGEQEKGFLTMFEDVGGFGAWNRRWCSISGPFIKYWKYPDDENGKDCMDYIDLRDCSSRKVETVSRDICARMHTFELTLIRPAGPGDQNNLVQEIQGSAVVRRVLLSADSKDEKIVWCDKLNRTLANIRAWDPDARKPGIIAV